MRRDHDGRVRQRMASATRESFTCSTTHGRDGSGAGDRKDRDRRLRGPRREEQLEERDGVAPGLLARPDGAVAAADDERRTLEPEEPDTGPQARRPAAGQRAAPRVGERGQLHDGPGAVDDPPRPRPPGELGPARTSRHTSIGPRRTAPSVGSVGPGTGAHRRLADRRLPDMAREEETGPAVAPRRRVRRQPRPGLALVTGFAALIAIGSVLLLLPISSASGDWTNPIVALFTATSAVCVTGLVVVDTATYWSPFGQVVVLAADPAGRARDHELLDAAAPAARRAGERAA